MNVIEYVDAKLYAQRVGRWMELREGENCYILGSLPNLIASANDPRVMKPRLLAIEEGSHVLAGAVLYPGGCLAVTWATQPMLNTLVEGLFRAGCQVSSVHGPADVAEPLAGLWAQRTGQQCAVDRAERVYQLARSAYTLPATGRLAWATPADSPIITPWLADFTREAGFEHGNLTELRDSLLTHRQLFLWKNPEPVSMAAWVSPTPNGGCINLVYTPAAIRGQGHAAAVVAALGRHMLSSGQHFCFIMADADDHRLHRLYQRVGARTIAELVRWQIMPAAARPPAATLAVAGAARL